MREFIYLCFIWNLLFICTFSRKYEDNVLRFDEIHRRTLITKGRRRVLLNHLQSSSFNHAKESLSKMLSLIRNRYEMDGPHGGQFFLTANNIDLATWNILKYKFASKILGTNETFLMTFGGSSVTAGHDSYYNQSYPAVVERGLGPILAGLGVELVVHNIAQGANNCAPYILCYESMGGVNPDFVGWEQSYNCGRDDGIFETAARVAGWSAQRGGVVYYSASGAWSPKNCPPSTDNPPFSSDSWTPASANLSEWVPHMSDVEKEKQLLLKFNQDKATAARFSGSFANDYKGIGFHGFNVWEKNKHCSFVNPKTNKTESCTGIDAAGGCAMRFMTHEAALYGSDNQKGADWHPTRAFHLLRGEAIVWLYSLILFETVHMIEDGLTAKTAPALLTEYRSFLNNLKPFPHPKKCHPYRCDKRPICHTDFKPHYSRNMTLTELVVGSTNWTYDAAEYGEWSLHYGYLDAKPLFRGTSDQGELHLKIVIEQTAEVWLCGGLKESFLHAQFHLDPNVNLDDLDTRQHYAPSSRRTLWTKRKYAGFECKALLELPVGTHVLSVSTNSTVETHATTLSHVIMWK